MSISDSDMKKFKEALIKKLDKCCYRSRATKDSGKEYVVLLGNQRVEINGKRTWTSEKSAQNAISRYIVSGKAWGLGANSVWRYEIDSNYTNDIPKELEKIAAPIRLEWARKNLRTIPLRDYMMLEYNRAKNS